MASLQKKSDTWYCQFCFLGKRHTVTVGKVAHDEAEVFAGSVDLILLRLRQNLITLPPDVTIDQFVLAGGKVPERPIPKVEALPFSAFRQKYLDTHRHGAMEANSLATTDLHLGHFQRTLGERFPLQQLQLTDLQGHINRRREKKYRGKKLSPVTLKKEMASFRAAWNWAAHTGLVKGPFPGAVTRQHFLNRRTFSQKVPYPQLARINIPGWGGSHKVRSGCRLADYPTMRRVNETSDGETKAQTRRQSVVQKGAQRFLACLMR